MENALIVGLSRQAALARELDVIANNMANVNTNGFKARASRFAEYLDADARGDAFPRPDRQVSFVIDAGTGLDLADGAVQETGNPLHIALRGDGFLAVETEGGERYTRNGALQLDAQGRLVTSDGFPVMGVDGPIVLQPEDIDVSIAPDGLVETPDGPRGRLRLVRFEDPNALSNVGANLFSSAAEPLPADATVRVAQGALERSNVQAVREMTRLMEVSRAYSRIAGILGGMQDLRRDAIQKLSEAA